MKITCSFGSYAIGVLLSSFFILVCSFSASAEALPISCIHNTNVSLGQSCESTIYPEDVLSESNSGLTYILMLTTASGSVIPNNLLTDIHLWTTVTGKVTDSAGNSCWGYIHVEDKLAPSITCADITIDCYDMNSYSATATDACSDATISLLNESIAILPCNDDYIKRVTQEYKATDSYGNTSSCAQSITLRKFDPTTIVWPSDFLLVDNTNLTCKDPLNSEGTPDISVTGVPTSNGISIFPYTDLYCNIGVEYRDVVIVDFGCSKKLMRTWYVYDWTCNGTVEYNDVQSLEIDDTELPQITACPSVLEYDADGSVGCDRTIELQLPTVTDDCSSILEIDVTYDGGFVNNATTNPTVTLSGSSVVTYTVYDRCDNSASCSTLITIRDNLSPTALCDQNSVVSLRSDGTGLAFSGTFDDGSYDDCDLYKTVIRKLNPDCGCERPTYDDMTYLGGHNGHFYYLSKWKTTAPWAFGLATGLGAQMVSLDTPEEAAWVVGAATAICDSSYIGLSDIGHPGLFYWQDHLAPNYTNWAPGQVDAAGVPLVPGNYVHLNENGEWEISSGAENLKYIIEVSDPCGFSDRVDFCCQDVGTQQLVLLRAIDFSGRTNECEARVTVQDKIAPIIACPKDFTIECGTTFDPNNTVLYGTAEATDQCTSNITFVLNNNISSTCATGYIEKVFTASDNNGSSSCTQTFYVTSATGFNPNNIVWPQDYEVANGCNGSAYLPGTLPVQNGFPQYTTGTCDNVSQSYSDQVFSFSGPSSDACRKIVRTWTVMDACSPQVLGLNPRVYQQAIKVNNNTAPTITGCAPLQVNTVDCNSTNVNFSVTALDDCAPQTNVSGTINFYLFSGATLTSTNTSAGNITYFNEILPVGTHSAIVSYSDFCGNTESCTKVITVTNTTTPTITCKAISVNIQAMDLDNDPTTPAINMAMINPQALIESTYNPCNYTLNYSFAPYSANTPVVVERIFNCSDRNTVQAVTVYAYDYNGIGSTCSSNVTIQDNNNLCSMLIENQVVLTGCENATFQEISCPSTGPSVDFDVLASSSNCASSGTFTYTARIDYNSDNTIDILDTGSSFLGYSYSQVTLPGTHSIEVVVTDECGSSASCNKSFAVSCNTITPAGGNGGTHGISGCEDEEFLMANCSSGSAPLSFDIDYSDNNCGIPGDLLVVAKVDFYSDGSNDLREDLLVSEIYRYNFPTVPGEHTLDITFTDPCGTVENCVKIFTVECLNGVTGDGNAIVRGKVVTEESVAVEEVMVALEGSQLDQEMTNNDGNYEFPAMDFGGQYRISPTKNTQPLNGVSTLDLIYIQRHILGIERLSSPYKIIAADINKSGNINGIDLVELRKLILGIYDEFPNNESWRMIDKNSTFFNALDPFASSLDESYIINDLAADMEVDFIGVKIGDVNNTVELLAQSKLANRSSHAFGLILDERKYEKGSAEEIIISLPASDAILGLQASLDFDTERIELIDIVPMTDELSLFNFNLNAIQQGKVTLSWNSEQVIESKEVFFKAKVNVLKDSWTSDLVTIAYDGIQAEAYTPENTLALKLNFEQETLGEESIKLYQNTPNPWSAETEIKYYLPSATDVILSLYDINGKLIYQEQKLGEKGINIVPLVRTDLRVSGVLYYELVADNYRAIEKMILID